MWGRLTAAAWLQLCVPAGNHVLAQADRCRSCSISGCMCVLEANADVQRQGWNPTERPLPFEGAPHRQTKINIVAFLPQTLKSVRPRMPIGRLVPFLPHTHPWLWHGRTSRLKEAGGHRWTQWTNWQRWPLTRQTRRCTSCVRKSYLKPKTVSAVVTTTLCVEQEAIQDWCWRFKNVVQWGTDWISCDLNKA